MVVFTSTAAKSPCPMTGSYSICQLLDDDDDSISRAPTNDTDILVDNETYSIDLSSSWTNQIVTFNQIQKTAPVLRYAALWADSTNSSFYAWGGEVSAALPTDKCRPAPQSPVWKPTPSSGGSRSWAEQFMSSTSLFPYLTRPAGAYGAYGNGTGHPLGGYSSAGTSQETARPQGFAPIPGRGSYAIEAGTWKNESATGY
jgi:hypothetical protein